MRVVKTNNSTRAFTVRLPEDVHLALKIHAARLRREMGDIVAELIQKHLAVVAVVEGKGKA